VPDKALTQIMSPVGPLEARKTHLDYLSHPHNVMGRAALKNWPIHVPLNNFYCIFSVIGICKEYLRLPVSQEIWRQVDVREMRR
jgi:hypothetical protein